LKTAYIGGSGTSSLSFLAGARSEQVDTPYGSVQIYRVELPAAGELIFLPRHNMDHSVPPHLINYQANIWALHTLGVEGILAVSAVGSLRPQLLPGQLVVLDSFIDMTSGRKDTFYEEGPVVHTDMTAPYCRAMSDVLLEAGKELGLELTMGCYVCVNGPRYETKAEIRAFAMLGGDVIGMTGVPEVVLARELGMCYAGLCLVTNLGAGLTTARQSHEEVVRTMQGGLEKIEPLVVKAIAGISALTCTDC